MEILLLCVHKVPQKEIKMVKDDILKVRMTKDEKEKLRYLARKKGYNMSEYIKYCIMKVSISEVEQWYEEEFCCRKRV